MKFAIWWSELNRRLPMVTDGSSPVCQSWNTFALLSPPSLVDVAFQSFNQLLTVGWSDAYSTEIPTTRRESTAIIECSPHGKPVAPHSYPQSLRRVENYRLQIRRSQVRALVGAPKLYTSRRLFVGNSAVQNGCDLRMNLAATHVHVLRHRHLRVAELVGTEPGRQPSLINQRRHRLSE